MMLEHNWKVCLMFKSCKNMTIQPWKSCSTSNILFLSGFLSGSTVFARNGLPISFFPCYVNTLQILHWNQHPVLYHPSYIIWSLSRSANIPTGPSSVKTNNIANGNCITIGKSTRSRQTHSHSERDGIERMQEHARNALMVLRFRKKENNSVAVDPPNSQQIHRRCLALRRTHAEADRGLDAEGNSWCSN